jgi:hypothetical protein
MVWIFTSVEELKILHVLLPEVQKERVSFQVLGVDG